MENLHKIIIIKYSKNRESISRIKYSKENQLINHYF